MGDNCNVKDCVQDKAIALMKEHYDNEIQNLKDDIERLAAEVKILKDFKRDVTKNFISKFVIFTGVVITTLSTLVFILFEIVKSLWK